MDSVAAALVPRLADHNAQMHGWFPMLAQSTPVPLRKVVMSKATSLTEQHFYSTLVRQLRSAREARGLSQQDVSMIVGVSDAMVGKWEALMKMPTAFGLMCWCQALGVALMVVAHDR
jgi:ribosome-binding protein aMBF1 (putative translation factor)